MAPKRSVKAAPRASKQTPVLSMLLDSPSRGGPSRTNTTSGSSASLGHRTLLAAKPPNGLRNDFKSSFSSDKKGKSRDTTNDLDLLWCDRFAPREKADVGIHKKKIEQVENWLREALDVNEFVKRYRRVLVVSGPAGSGKSTLIRILSQADELNFEVIEWGNDDGQMGLASDHYWDRGSTSQDGYSFDTFDRTSALPSKLSVFLSSASRYPSLALQEDGEEKQAVLKPPSRSSSRRIILLEDLPNLSHFPTRSAFLATLEAFLEQSGDCNTPLVVILSESAPHLDDWGTEESRRNFKDHKRESLSVRSTIPHEIRYHAAFANIGFNAVAKTILAKVLKRILELARPLHPQSIPVPSSIAAKEVLDAVVESASGDIRSAINTLQVACLTKAPGLETRGIKRTSNGNAVDKGSKRAIAAISAKESSLVIFHTLGRILYNKRVGDPVDKDNSEEEEEIDTKCQESTDDLPSHWQPLLRRKSRVKPEMLWRSMPVDPSSFQAHLHQNYAMFCDNIEQCTALLDNMSYAESIRTSHEEILNGPLIDYYKFLITVYGTLVSLPSPMPKRLRPLKGPAMFYKQKQIRENMEKLDDIRLALQKATIEGTASMTMSDASMMRLVCELLPMISKSHPDIVPSSVEELVKLPWNTSRTYEEQNEEEEEEGEVEEEVMDVSLGNLIEAGQSYQKNSSSQVLLPPAHVESNIDEEGDDDDEIEEF